MSDTLNNEYMILAIEEARKNFTTGNGGPFGATIIKDGKVIAVAANSVLQGDSTAHAEVNAIRKACTELNTHDLSGSIIYSTTEPCPMCFSAIHWAKIDKIVYGTSIEDVQKLGFNELTISNQDMKRLGNSPVELISDFMRDECYKMLEEWKNETDKQVY